MMDIIFLFNFSICKDFLVRPLNFSPPPPPISIPFPPVTKKKTESVRDWGKERGDSVKGHCCVNYIKQKNNNKKT